MIAGTLPMVLVAGMSGILFDRVARVRRAVIASRHEGAAPRVIARGLLIIGVGCIGIAVGLYTGWARGEAWV